MFTLRLKQNPSRHYVVECTVYSANVGGGFIYHCLKSLLVLKICRQDSYLELLKFSNQKEHCL